MPRPDPRAAHARAIRTRDPNRAVYHALITAYGRSPATLPYAGRLFHHHLPHRPTAVTWTALISAHAGTPAAPNLFLSMLRSSPSLPNQRTLATLLNTCAALAALPLGAQLHALALKLSLSHLPFSGSALVHLYSTCRLPGPARLAFDEIPNPDEVCFAAAIVGLARNACPHDALLLFSDMRRSSAASSMYSLSGTLRAAAEAAALDQCRAVHAHAIGVGLDGDVVVATALVDAYGKAGMVEDARKVFDGFAADANVVGWNAMMAAYAQHGDVGPVLRLFDEMPSRELVPDELTFLAVLTCYSNVGAVVEARTLLDSMPAEHGVDPGLEHYTCLVGAMARVGKLGEAHKVVQTMPFEPDAAVWRTLLCACAFHGNADLGETAGGRLLQLDPGDDAAYTILANIYAAAGRLRETAEVRRAMKGRGIRKESGRSWIEWKGVVHVFLAGDRRHERSEEIHAKLGELLKRASELGYEERTELVLQEVESAEKREFLWYHSEKLAVAFGMLDGGVPAGKPVRVVKNLRICRDCHEFFKCLSRAIGREIVVRDVNRYHRFEGGSCGCGDLW